MPQSTRNGTGPKGNGPKGNGEVTINQKQEKLVWARLYAAGKNPEDLRGILERRGYAAVGAIKKSALDAILEEIEGVTQTS